MIAQREETRITAPTVPGLLDQQAQPHDSAAATEERKAWTTLMASAALLGWQLWRSDAADGPQRYFLGRWGRIRACTDSAEVERVLDQIGGHAE